MGSQGVNQSEQSQLQGWIPAPEQRMTALGLLGATFSYILNNVWRLVLLTIVVGVIGGIFFLIAFALGYILVALLNIPKPFPANMIWGLLLLAVLVPICTWYGCTLFISARRGVLAKQECKTALMLLLARFWKVFVVGAIVLLLTWIPGVFYYLGTGRVIFGLFYGPLGYAERLVSPLGPLLALPFAFSMMEVVVRGKGVRQSLVSSIGLFRKNIGRVLCWALLVFVM
ncbi:MAG: hypothetical protein QGD94_05500, partial [Planctomycetia bacterium]|nr:hypothetical protein [Planctomycetia bacterium]